MEIKQGDKVRVSKDIPQFYRRYNSYRVFEVEHQVVDIEDGLALLDSIPVQYVTTIPTKYLIKVDAEVKGSKIKAGDRVKIKRECLDYDKPIDDTYTFSVIPSEVIKIEDGIATLYMADSIPPKTLWARVEALEKFVKPTEQTEAEEYARIRQMEAELNEFRKAELDRVFHPEKYYTSEVTIDNVAMNWQKYEADLAKELAIAYAKRGKSPLDAVATAKEIAKRLKKK